MVTKLVIAVVEDHDDLRDAMVDALSSRGHKVLSMSDAEQFAETVARVSVDIAIIDVNLLGEDGLSLTKRLHHAQPGLGIIIASAHGLVQEKTKGYESGADIYLTKPIALQELVAAVHALGQRVKVSDTSALAQLQFAQLQLIGPRGASVAMPWHEAVLLRALILAQDHQVEYWQLIEVMGKNTTEYTKAALELVVVRLRKRMQSVGFEQNVITAVRNKGYRLLVNVSLS